MLKREDIARIKEKYPKGTPIHLYCMAGETTVPPGSRGVVDHVDDIGQIHVKWENGSSLHLMWRKTALTSSHSRMNIWLPNSRRRWWD